MNQERERDDGNSIERGDTNDTGESKDTNASPGDSSSNANPVIRDSEAKIPPSEDSLTRPEEVKDLPTESQDMGNTTQDKRDTQTESESQNIVKENQASANCINEGREDREVFPQKVDDQATDGASAVAEEQTEASSSISHDPSASISHGDETPRSPVVMVKTSPVPDRPHSNRPTSSTRKIRCA